MVEDWLAREKMLLGEAAVQKLGTVTAAVVGVGGVGSAAAEALCRAGIGHLILVDNDVVCPSNLNRQLIATTKTVGMNKAKAMEQRALDINPGVKITAIETFYSAANYESLFQLAPDIIIDAIDSLPSKIDLICRAQEKDIPIISAMGTGNKLDPTRLEVTDISKTSVCPLARSVRRELRKRGIYKHTVVFSTENPIEVEPVVRDGELRHVPGTVSWVPPVAGMILAGWAVKKILEMA